VHHFLPSLAGHEAKESIDLSEQLQTYFEYVENVWRLFVPEPLKSKFPRSFRFPVTVPFFIWAKFQRKFGAFRNSRLC
jgi:hypothetical protein